MPAKPSYLLLAGGGAILLWSGLKGKSVTSVAHALIGGQDPASASQANAISGLAAPPGTAGATASTPGVTGPVSSSNSARQNQAIAKMLAISMGHADWTTGQQWADWLALWTRESGWDATAYYPSTHTTNPDDSHAFGIPQALPASKMASAGADWRTNPATQIKWGIGYISQTYGSPSSAWGHEQSAGWY